MYHIVLCFLTSFILSYVAIPSIINIAKIKKLVDEPGERRSHDRSIPTLGGIGIFAGVIFSIILWTPFEVFGNLQYILCAFIIIFLIGAKDDIIPLTPYKKILGEIFACSILVFIANIRITSFYGIFSIEELPEWISILISIFTLIVIINSINLIDGINGLTASMGILICVTLGAWFYLADQIVLSIIAFALVGSLVAFLKFNITPAKIFMGDTGSLLVGIICAILIIRFIEVQNTITNTDLKIKAAPAVAVSILFLPLFDALRVFILRIIHSKSPFDPDRNHLHHAFVDKGFSHIQTSALLVFINAFAILLAVNFQKAGNLKLLGLLFLLGIIVSVFAKKIPSLDKSKA